uniref:Mediator of RNA polymerase II transcription subunit 31 n=1 Tax=Chlamydomonas euryale TaxID=1486919 RepID=A0A7R9VA92_9CHLO|mmetsp:Transcript_28221/g.83565  ORF Transcript_28221/g.83565 Transcript_28221/m.83565 type:complete len:150 (+) Transcript_28221:238-687(+)
MPKAVQRKLASAPPSIPAMASGMDVDPLRLAGAGPRQLMGASDQERGIIELEFVQCLANPHYLNWLAQNRYFDDPAFVKYLDYLQYWRQAEYAHLIRYPHCLFFLDLLQSAAFRKSVANNRVAEFIHAQQFHFWQHYALNRSKEAAQLS